MTKKHLLTLFVLLTGVAKLEAMVADSRYFPGYPHPYERTLERRSIFEAGAFFVTASNARGNESLEHIGIPEIWGFYDQKQLSDAIEMIGKTSPLLSQWQIQRTIVWDMNAKMEGQGGYFQVEFGSKHGISFGGSTGVMHLTSDLRFFLPAASRRVTLTTGVTVDSDPRRDLMLSPAQEEQLDAERRAMNTILGFDSVHWSATGFTDTELHLRYGFVSEYRLKCRKIDGGVFLGALIPSGVKRQPINPASVPFGGNGFSGIYGGLEGTFELKEDWELNLRIQGSKRFAKTQNSRIPVNYESILFGALEGPLRIDPGASFYFSPTFTVDDLRDGFGFALQYCMAIHGGDVFTDERPDQTIPSTLNGLYNKSKWAAEYGVVTLFYNHDKIRTDEGVWPYIVLQCDIPMHLMVSEDFSKTTTLSLGVSFHF